MPPAIEKPRPWPPPRSKWISSNSHWSLSDTERGRRATLIGGSERDDVTTAAAGGKLRSGGPPPPCCCCCCCWAEWCSCASLAAQEKRIRKGLLFRVIRMIIVHSGSRHKRDFFLSSKPPFQYEMKEGGGPFMLIKFVLLKHSFYKN